MEDNAPKGTPVFINADNTREIIIVAIREWAAEFPDDVRAFDKQVRLEREGLANERGLSKTKSQSKIMEIPTKLAYKIQRMTHRDWQRDSSILTVLYQEFKLGRVGHKTGGVQKQ